MQRHDSLTTLPQVFLVSAGDARVVLRAELGEVPGEQVSGGGEVKAQTRHGRHPTERGTKVLHGRGSRDSAIGHGGRKKAGSVSCAIHEQLRGVRRDGVDVTRTGPRTAVRREASKSAEWGGCSTTTCTTDTTAATAAMTLTSSGVTSLERTTAATPPRIAPRVSCDALTMSAGVAKCTTGCRDEPGGEPKTAVRRVRCQ